jgi:hypothetical protein
MPVCGMRRHFVAYDALWRGDFESGSVTSNPDPSPSELVLVQYVEPTTKLNDSRLRVGLPTDEATHELGKASS